MAFTCRNVFVVKNQFLMNSIAGKLNSVINKKSLFLFAPLKNYL